MVQVKSQLASLAMLAASVSAKEIQLNSLVHEKLYESGQIHEEIMQAKLVGESAPFSNFF